MLPLKNAMRIPSDFDKTFGVLNVGMVFVTIIFLTTGFFGYLKYGEDVQGSLTLNLPPENMYIHTYIQINILIIYNFIILLLRFAQAVKVMISTGVLLGYALQFFVAIQIMMPTVLTVFHVKEHVKFAEILFRTFMVLVTCEFFIILTI